jgi:CheY-like chemotaxis protein
LLVEDNAINRKLALKLLEKSGYLAVAVDDGKKAVEKIIAAPDEFSMVLMDCQMPVMDGFTATEAIRAHEKETGRHIPIVAMTANAMSGDRERCLAVGMDEYIPKPIDRALLAAMVERFTKQLQA